MFAAVVELCGWIVAIVGYVFVLLGPDRRGVRGLAIAALAVGGVHFILNLAVKIPYLPSGIFNPDGPHEREAGFVILWLFVHLLYVAELILFLLALRSMALAAGRRRVAARTGTNIFLLSLFGGIRVIGFIFFFIAVQQWLDLFNPVHPRTTPPVAMTWVAVVFMWLGIVLYVPFVINYILHIGNVRGLVGRG
jgi:hypothetical protein